MIAMWGANSFRTMQKLLGLFSGRYLRGSQNIRMAKQLKPIEGHIDQVNAPRFAEDRNMWVMIELFFSIFFYFLYNPNLLNIIYIIPTRPLSPTTLSLNKYPTANYIDHLCIFDCCLIRPQRDQTDCVSFSEWKIFSH